MVDEERAPLIERSHNERSLRSKSSPKGHTGKPPGDILQGGTPGEELLDGVASLVESADAAPVDEYPLDIFASNLSSSDSSNLSINSLPNGNAAVPAVISKDQVEESVAKSSPSAGPRQRSRYGRVLVPTEAAALSSQDLDYLTPLTSIDEVVSRVETIDSWYHEWTRNCNVFKIAEGSFGSILRLQNKTNPTQFTIGKLMPLRARRGAGSKTSSFTRVQDAASETEMLITMSNYQGFAEFRRAEVLHGKLPPSLKHAYERFSDRYPSGSKTKVKFGNHQLWLFLEMSYAGTDLEEIFKKQRGKKNHLSVRETWDIFWAVASALAMGEAEVHFEHRDLQIQNICIKRYSQFLKTRGDEERLGFKKYTDLEVTIIDYTLSRATLEDSRTIFNPMEDEGIFKGQGDDPDEVLQYDTYRSMQQLIKNSSRTPPKGRKNAVTWDTFAAATNVLWLCYLLKTLLRHTARHDKRDDLVARQDEDIRSDLERLCMELEPENPKWVNYRSASELVSIARCKAEIQSIIRKDTEN